MKIRTVSLIRNPFSWFYLLLPMALLARVSEDLFNHRWDIHAGVIFDYRHAGGVPLYSTNVLSFELALLIAGAVLLLTKQKRMGALLAVVAGGAVLYLAVVRLLGLDLRQFLRRRRAEK